MSDHLGLPFVAAAQNQKEVTINEAVNLLDRSGNADATIALADADITLTATQVRQNALITFTGALTALRVVTLPAGKRQTIIRNATTGGRLLEVGYAAGLRATVPPGASVIVQGNGTDCLALGATYEIAFYVPGTLLGSQRAAGLVMTRRVALPAGLGGSRAFVETAPAAAADFSFQRNGVGIGGMSFAPAQSVATFTLTAETILEPGDRLALIAPSPADTTLADLYVNLRGRPL